MISRPWAQRPSSGGTLALGSAPTPASLFQSAWAKHVSFPSLPKGPVNLLPISKINLLFSSLTCRNYSYILIIRPLLLIGVANTFAQSVV